MGEVMLVKQLFCHIIINLKVYHRTHIVHDSLMGKLFRRCHMLVDGRNPYIDSKCMFFMMYSVLLDDFSHCPLASFAKQWKTSKFLVVVTAFYPNKPAHRTTCSGWRGCSSLRLSLLFI